MRKLVILRGAPGSGKSTFIHKNQLEEFTLCPDSLRLLFESPVLTLNGKLMNSHNHEKKVWELLLQLLEYRMKNGDFTVIDATNTRKKDFKPYIELAEKYFYSIYCVDFSNTDLETIKIRNNKRDEYKVVPDDVIDKMHHRLMTSPVPENVPLIHPEEFKEKVFTHTLDLSRYKKIHHLGDIHGCATVLNQFLVDFSKDEFYIFTGDYIDRGIENPETLKLLFSLSEKDNVVFLEGNHDRSLKFWGRDEESNHHQFNSFTKIQLEKSSIAKKQCLSFYTNLKECFLYSYYNKKILVTHGGLPSFPKELSLISSRSLIFGVGDYETNIDDFFTKQSSEECFQVHGHRNRMMLPIFASKRSFNLEGNVEKGGHLRILTLDKEGFHGREIKNEVYSDFYHEKINY